MKKHIILSVLILHSFLSFSQCPENIYGMGTQAEVDNFLNLYPDCEHAYTLIIDGPDIVDLSPLSPLISIDNLILRNSDNISSLLAFDNTIINASLQIINYNQITSLDGIHLNNDFDFFWLWIQDNDQLQNLDGLENLQAISQSTKITGNNSINSIAALENTNILTELQIENNPNLSFCAIHSVCNAIINPNVIVTIANNAIGCNTVQEVEIICQLSISNNDLSQSLIIYPNPVSSNLQINMSDNILFEKAILYSVLGKQILKFSENQIDLQTLSAGVYFMEVFTDKGSVIKRIIKE